MNTQVAPDQIKVAILWACQWVVMKCCAAIDSAITPALFRSSGKFSNLSNVFDLCRNVLGDSLVFKQVDLFFYLSDFNDATFTGNVIDIILFDNVDPIYRSTMVFIGGRIKEWWLNKAQEIIGICVFQKVDKKFTQWLAERFQESSKELCSLFDDMEFAKAVARSLTVMTPVPPVDSPQDE